MPVKIIYSRPHKARLVKELITIQVKARKPLIIEEASEILRFFYAQTFEGWNGGKGKYATSYSSSKIFPVPEVAFDEEFEQKGFGLRLKIYSLAVYPGGEVAHNLWYWIDKGTKTTQQQRTSPLVYPTKQRTYTGGYPKAFDGFDSPAFVVRAGTYRRGIEAQDWSGKIANDFLTELQRRNNTLGGITGWVATAKIENPKLVKV